MEPHANTLSVFSRNYYIQKKYQSRMILKFCLLAFLGTLIFCFVFYGALNRELGGGYNQALAVIHLLKSEMVLNFLLAQGAIILIMGSCVLVLTLFASHRIAGPLWRIEQTTKAVARGELSARIHLRDDDEVKDLADQVNRMITGLRTRLTDINVSHKLLERDLGLIRERIIMGGMTPEESLRHANDLLDTSNALFEKLNEIKTD